MVSAGADHAAGVTASGTIWTWGGNIFRHLGQGQNTPRVGPRVTWERTGVDGGVRESAHTSADPGGCGVGVRQRNLRREQHCPRGNDDHARARERVARNCLGSGGEQLVRGCGFGWSSVDVGKWRRRPPGIHYCTRHCTCPCAVLLASSGTNRTLAVTTDGVVWSFGGGEYDNVREKTFCLPTRISQHCFGGARIVSVCAEESISSDVSSEGCCIRGAIFNISSGRPTCQSKRPS